MIRRMGSRLRGNDTVVGNFSGHESRVTLLIALALSGIALPLVTVHAAEAWPMRPVRIVAPFPPGGTADTLGRLVADKLGARFKQNFIVDNRPGAGGTIGSDIVAKAAPDGYTLVVSGIASHVIAPAGMEKAPFDPMKDFTHIALLGGPPQAAIVHPGTQARNLGELVTLSKSAPKGVSYGSPGPGTHGHLIGELFRMKTGANLVHISYRGAGLTIVDLVAGQIPLAFITLTTAAPQIKAGRARLLAYSAANRLPGFADVPTFAESGYRDLVATTWFSISGPAGMPVKLVAQLNREIRAILQSPDVRERLAVDGIEANELDAKGFGDFVRAEIARWTPIVRAAK